MPRFRKKPVEIEARQFTEESKDGVFGWVRNHADGVGWGARLDGRPTILIPTLEGVMAANLGDWVIRGVNGEFYPCKPDIFEKTYEPVEPAGRV